MAIDKVIERLKQFDLNYDYGPCIGITRLERWKRANKLGLNPDRIILIILTSEKISQQIANVNESLWYSEKYVL
jgi:DNA polymerase delta subunit 4